MKKLSNKPILFLNVDGVLTSARTYLWAAGSEPRATLDPTAIGMLAEVYRQCEIDIVIASAWAGFFPTPESWTSLFESVGFELPVHAVIDENSYLNDPTRSIEDLLATKENTVHVVLDDDAHRPDSKLCVVLTDRLIGLSIHNVEQTVRVLAPTSPMLATLASLRKSFV